MTAGVGNRIVSVVILPHLIAKVEVEGATAEILSLKIVPALLEPAIPMRVKYILERMPYSPSIM